MVDPNYFIQTLPDYLPDNAIVCVDIGQNQMWATSLVIKKGQRFITQGGMAAMGSSLPMAIGAAFAEPDKTIISICGDGGFQLNIQELQTIYHHNLNIKIILLNNHCYGMIRQFQTQYFESRFQSSVVGYSCPDFNDVVSAYKIFIAANLTELFKDNRPGFLEVIIDPDCKVSPKLAVGKPIEEQDE